MSPGSSHAIPSRSIRRATFAQLFIATALRRPPNMDNQARGGNARNWKNICRLFRLSNFAKIDNQFSEAVTAGLSSAQVLDQGARGETRLYTAG